MEKNDTGRAADLKAGVSLFPDALHRDHERKHGIDAHCNGIRGTDDGARGGGESLLQGGGDTVPL